jgi:hypothetical protein
VTLRPFRAAPHDADKNWSQASADVILGLLMPASPRWSLTRRGRREYVAAAGLFGLLVVVFFAPIFTSHKTFSTVHQLQQRAYPWYDPQHPTKNPYYVQTDQAAVYYPWEVLTDNSLKEHGDWHFSASSHPTSIRDAR